MKVFAISWLLGGMAGWSIGMALGAIFLLFAAPCKNLTLSSSVRTKSEFEKLSAGKEKIP